MLTLATEAFRSAQATAMGQPVRGQAIRHLRPCCMIMTRPWVSAHRPSKDDQWPAGQPDSHHPVQMPARDKYGLDHQRKHPLPIGRPLVPRTQVFHITYISP